MALKLPTLALTALIVIPSGAAANQRDGRSSATPAPAIGFALNLAASRVAELEPRHWTTLRTL